MESLLFLLGIGCLSWTLAELLATLPPLRHGGGRAAFGAVDLETDRDLDVVFDRRGASRDRRSPDAVDCSLWA